MPENPEIILIVGLPGSGKTTLAKGWHEMEQYKDYVLLDDITKNHTPEQLDQLLDEKFNIILTDPTLCDPENREYATERLVASGYKCTWVFFENDEKKCWNNLRHRDDGRNISTFKPFKYEIPPGVMPYVIWQKD